MKTFLESMDLLEQGADIPAVTDSQWKLLQRLLDDEGVLAARRMAVELASMVDARINEATIEDFDVPDFPNPDNLDEDSKEYEQAYGAWLDDEEGGAFVAAVQRLKIETLKRLFQMWGLPVSVLSCSR